MRESRVRHKWRNEARISGYEVARDMRHCLILTEYEAGVGKRRRGRERDKI